MKKQLVWTLAGAGSFLLSLITLAPLPVVAQQLLRLLPEVHLAGVSGTLWQGTIERVTTPSAQIDRLTWKLVPARLLSGMLAAQLEAEVQTAQVRGECGISLSTQWHCAPLRVELDAANVARLAPVLQSFPATLGGTFNANLTQLSWDRVGIPLVTGELTWLKGSIQQPLKVELGGEYRARIRAATTPDDALNITLQSDKALIVLDGKIDVAKDGQYRSEFFLKPSAEADPSLAQGLSLLGAPQADGSIRLKQDGQLPWPVKPLISPP